ncbi:aspartyl-phosphate phosphatase Spo0E family protein [Priestia megaterium]|uniref:aspartyl-phosphate phosphatase Spo0E family protein n=1 Tax=Priestia megaterium TaxID=1404 RepID=UPI000D5091B2|nr:aspartyl-phosphate phosphatase Spo0E family protein [Priestia megaterium]PVE64409.1 Spo0E family sporulation regulatory protein-aspartic acid phosphatase [Priestia megaterium]PVE79925.1 Spo0E family sporulation regulatory protein-aspartic acid phosphatase [Priestia megaterium]PVE81425.1 Spo0E family sporulation regulatory protein-aspartic acid phosphatase [Priestia megaterium]PVE99490.1 Spo0E family sporulation regulatory protein-aspartic acid phosphatase [Priestia megaterium]
MQTYKYNNTLKKALLVDIEAGRELMIQVGLEEGFTSKNAIVISQFIDQLLNQLEKITATD